ncbi:MAG: hypothetical protein ACYCZ0_02170, partial [Minisyncoccota bacterium]
MVDETTGQNAASNPTPDTGGIPTAPAGAAQSNPLNAPVSVGSTSPIPPSPQPSEAALGNDIAKILKEVKLPARPENVPGKEQRPAAQTKDIDALLSGTPAQAQPTSQVAPAKPEPAPETPEPTKDAVQSVHTLKQDLQQVVHDQKISVVRAAAHEQEKQHVPEEIVVKPHSNRVKNFIFAAFLLLFLGGAALGGV